MKKTGEKTYKIDGNTYFIGGLILFVVTFVLTLILTFDILQALLIAIGLVIVTVPIVMIKDQLGKRKHQSIHYSKLFQSLYQEGFQIEKIGDYRGLIKNINDRTVRIYYNWDKQAKGPLSFGDIVVEILYEPIVQDLENFELKKDVIKWLNNKHKVNSWMGLVRYLTWNKLVAHYNYYPLTKPDQILKDLNENIKLLETESLSPVDMSNIKPQLEEVINNGWYYPDMQLIWDELERREAENDSY